MRWPTHQSRRHHLPRGAVKAPQGPPRSCGADHEIDRLTRQLEAVRREHLADPIQPDGCDSP